MTLVSNLNIDSRRGVAHITIDRGAEVGDGSPLYTDLPDDMRQALLGWIALGMPRVEASPDPVPTKIVGDEFVAPSKLVGTFDDSE